jgi:4-hydroxybenzoyl-CoA reductase subunit alpha
MNEFRVIGKSPRRKDGYDKVTGRALYTEDLKLPGMLVGKILRSPYPHALIKNIDVSKAENLPGVKAVVTARDTNKKFLTFMLPEVSWDKLPLADKKVRFVGDEVAAVAAEDEATALKALDLIDIAYEVLPANYTVEEALESTAAAIHEKGNISRDWGTEVGDVVKAFNEADHIVEEAYTLQSVAHAPIETHSALAQFEGADKLTIWSTTQAPYYLQFDLARALDLSMTDIRVAKTIIGAGFGGKSRGSEVDVIAALLARKSGKSVKVALTREEEMISARVRHPHRIRLQSAVRRDGRILGLKINIIIDNGAYNDVGPDLPKFECMFLSGLYGKITNISIKSQVVYTNKNWGGRYRAYGNYQITYAMECHIERIAEKLGLSSADVRLANITETNETSALGWRIGSTGLRECIERVAESMTQGFTKKPNHGIGLACYIHCTGWAQGEYGSAIVRWGNRGITLITGTTDIGQGCYTVLSMILAEALSVDYEAIKVVSMDTETTTLDFGSRSSRVTFIVGNAVLAAAEDVKRQLKVRASEKLEVPFDKVSYENGKVLVADGGSQKEYSPQEFLSGIGSRGGFEIIGQGVYAENAERGEDAWNFGCQGAEVRVDPETGEIKVLRMVAAHDSGTIINLAAAEGQVEGGIAQGLGFMLSEEIQTEKGVVLNPNFRDYKVPRSLDMPPMTVSFVQTNDVYGPYGAKGLGEGSIVPTAPAIANAVYDATGIRIDDLPATSEKMLAKLKGSLAEISRPNSKSRNP